VSILYVSEERDLSPAWLQTFGDIGSFIILSKPFKVLVLEPWGPVLVLLVVVSAGPFAVSLFLLFLFWDRDGVLGCHDEFRMCALKNKVARVNRNFIYLKDGAFVLYSCAVIKAVVQMNISAGLAPRLNLDDGCQGNLPDLGYTSHQPSRSSLLQITLEFYDGPHLYGCFVKQTAQGYWTVKIMEAWKQPSNGQLGRGPSA
jgi:hypothetical protein